MKRTVFSICAFIALLFGAQSANAQIANDVLRDNDYRYQIGKRLERVSSIHRVRDHYVDQDGIPLSDYELLELMKNTMGEEVYFETIVGARKQYKAGRVLITSGLIGMGAGILVGLEGVYLIESSYRSDVQGRKVSTRPRGPVGTLAAFLGYTSFVAGSLALTAGIPFISIGKSRLNWVEDAYPNGNEDVALEFGATGNGLGLTLRF